MKKKIIPILTFLLILAMSTSVFAMGRLPEVSQIGSSGTLAKMSGQVIGIIYAVAIVVSIAMLLIIGIKYMIAAPDQKANLKARAIPYLIGAALIFGAANILRFIETISTWMK